MKYFIQTLHNDGKTNTKIFDDEGEYENYTYQMKMRSDVVEISTGEFSRFETVERSVIWSLKKEEKK